MESVNSYLFLDIDGVVCTLRSVVRTMANYFEMEFHEEYWTDEKFNDKRKEEMDKIFQAKTDADPSTYPSWSMSNWPMCHMAINNLNDIVEETGCEVILSSSWRYTTGLKGTERKLKENGFRFDLKDQTPTDLQTSERGREIQHWLNENDRGCENYVIIDDDWQDIYGHHPDNLVVTQFNLGLTDIKKQLAIQIIKQGGIPRNKS